MSSIKLITLIVLQPITTENISIGPPILIVWISLLIYVRF